jgi:phosphoribosyl 1,2-cyclic phosphodiesterase
MSIPPNGIPFVREMWFRYGRADRLSPLIRRVVARNPGPFTFTGTGAHIVGHGQVAVIDPGPDDERQLMAILEATRGERITHIFVTHSHLDHSPRVASRIAISWRSSSGPGSMTATWP